MQLQYPKELNIQRNSDSRIATSIVIDLTHTEIPSTMNAGRNGRVTALYINYNCFNL